jgi:2-amino-4-hydroxy-6-hydroxymethyldihydropteridine diphosphokinase
MSKLKKAFISAGSNLGNRRANLDFALSSLAKGGTVSKISSCFETEPVGFPDQPWYLNIAVELETRLAPSELFFFCRSIETACGRVRTFPSAPRTLDLDILLYGDDVINEVDLIIPHPRLSERNFVLAPLAQIAPDVRHPLLKKWIRELMETCSDRSEVRLATGILE